jgi:copper chaperone CopZ
MLWLPEQSEEGAAEGSGVEDMKMDIEKKTATVKFDPTKTNTEALAQATAKAGFPATIRK